MQSERFGLVTHGDRRVIVIVDKMGKKVLLITLHQLIDIQLFKCKIRNNPKKLFAIKNKY